MSLLVWLPLISDTNNQGIANSTITTTGTALAYNDGKIGNAATFNSSAIVLNPAPLSTNTPELSFAFWFKTTDASATQCLYNGRASTGAALALFLVSGKFRFDDGAQHTFSSYSYPANTWVHVCVVRNSTNIKLYINGVLEQTLTSSSYTCNVTYASVGMSSTNTASPSGNAVVGQLNDYRIYDHALSVKEVKELAKGMVMHLSLSWGGNPNMIKNSYTFMNKDAGVDNQWTDSGLTYTDAVVEDVTAPCKWVNKKIIANSKSSAVNGAGCFYRMSALGLTSSDLVQDEYYTYRFWAKSDSGIASGFSFGMAEGKSVISYTGFGALNSSWRLHTMTFKCTSTSSLTTCFYVDGVPANSSVDFQICGFKLEKGQVSTPYIPNVEETAYTIYDYSTKYLQDVSGYNHTVLGYGSNNTSCESPRGISGTNCGSGSCIVLGKTCKIQYPMSFAFWFNTENLQNNSNRLISCTEGGGWNIELNGNYLCWTTGTGTSSNAYKYCTSTKTYTELQGAWHHVACTYDGLKSQIYIDGELSKETVHFTTATPLYYNANNGVFLAAEAVGSATTPATYTTETKLADFRMYATVISADDVKELYQVGAQIDKSGNVYCNELVEE